MELVGDDDDGLAVGAHGPEHGEELVRLLGGQHGGGLVQYEDVGAPVEDLDDLHGLLLGDGHVVNFLVGVHVEAVAVADGPDLFSGGPDVQPALFLQAQNNVFRRSEYVHQLVVLMDHADAVGVGVLRGTDGNRLAADEDFPLVGEIDAGEHVHQGSLTAAVLPQEGEDFTAVEGEVDGVVGDYVAKPLGDSF